MGKIVSLLLCCLLLAGCTPAAQAGTFSTTESATVENASENPDTRTQALAVVLSGCIAYEVDSAGGSLKTAIAASELVVFLAGDAVPDDLYGETAAWQAALGSDDRATMDANWPGVYRCAQGICNDLDGQQEMLDDAGVTTDFSAMDLAGVPDQLDTMNAALTQS